MWTDSDWPSIRRTVRRLQCRIAKAVKEGRWNKVRALQHLLTRSLAAKRLAVRRVTSNKGRKTPGVDGVVWRGARVRGQALQSLRRRGYQPQPLRRIYIPKKSGTKKRPLSIPTMHDRAMQALYKLALAPVAETTADPNSYGFREGRRCADATAAGFNALAKPNSAPWILDADILGCFDNIRKDWMLDHIPTDRRTLRQWLEAGYVENGHLYPTRKGTPQGGVISPTLMNMTLDGLEQAVHQAVPRRHRVNVVRYADDLIVTGKSRRLLEETVRPALDAFLAERGLQLSDEKTAITHIKHGFAFLGQTFRKHAGTLHITPSNDSVMALLQKLGTLIRNHVSAPMPALVKQLNQALRGWGNYHRHVVAGDAFSRINLYVYRQLWRMLRRRHPGKSWKWLSRTYWDTTGPHRAFVVTAQTRKGPRAYRVLRLTSTNSQRYVKVRAHANPYQPADAAYFWHRRHDAGATERTLASRRRPVL
ncbi:group II intron reverse transcriptase/maturase [Candidatus Latescibacterota bacterium]